MYCQVCENKYCEDTSIYNKDFIVVCKKCFENSGTNDFGEKISNEDIPDLQKHLLLEIDRIKSHLELDWDF